MTVIQKEKGVTLVELLAAIVIFSIIIISIWSFLFRASELNEREMSKTQLQQEANLIVNTIHNYHTKYEITELVDENTNSSITIKAKDGNGNTITETFKNSAINYKISKGSFSPPNPPPKPFEFSIRLSSSKNTKIYYETKTTFYKLE